MSKSSSANSSGMLNKQQLCQAQFDRPARVVPLSFILSRLFRQQYVIDAAVSIVIQQPWVELFVTGYGLCTSSHGDVLDFGSLSHKDVPASLQPPVAAEATYNGKDVSASW